MSFQFTFPNQEKNENLNFELGIGKLKNLLIENIENQFELELGLEHQEHLREGEHQEHLREGEHQEHLREGEHQEHLREGEHQEHLEYLKEGEYLRDRGHLEERQYLREEQRWLGEERRHFGEQRGQSIFYSRDKEIRSGQELNIQSLGNDPLVPHSQFKEQYSQLKACKKLLQKSKLFLSRSIQHYIPFIDTVDRFNTHPTDTAICASQKSIEKSIQQAIQLYQLHSIDSNLLQSNLMENLRFENDVKRFDPFHGNRLSIHEKDRVLACPLSDNLCELGVYSLNEVDNLSLISKKPLETCQLKTPITQVVGINNHASASFLLRSMEGIHFCKYTPDMDLALDEEGAYTLTFDSEPTHLAYNTHLSSQAAVMLPNAAVNIWDLESQTCYNWSQGGSEYIFQDQRDAWKICEFGAHPRTLLLADRNVVKLGDLRTNSRSVSSVFSITAEAESITSFSRSEIRRFQIAIATDKRSLLVDLRYPTNPLLEWRNVHYHETQNLVQFINRPFSNDYDCFYTWGRRHGEILFHFYDSPKNSESPPCSQFVQKIESFWKHPLVSLDPVSFISSKSHQESLLDKYEQPIWAPMIGSALVPSQNDPFCFSFYQMDATGALFTQVFSTKKDNDNHDTSSWSEGEDQILQESNMRELECLRQTLRIWDEKIKEIPNFEADHSIFDMKHFLEFCKKRIENELIDGNLNELNEINAITRNLIGSTISSFYEYLAPDLLKLDHQKNPSSLPCLSYHPSDRLLHAMKSKLTASNSLIIDSSYEHIYNQFKSLPSDNDKFSPETTSLANRVFSSDLKLASTLCYPRTTVKEVEYEDGTFESHQSQVSSSFWNGTKTLNGISSWLLDQWMSDKRVEDYTDINSSGCSSSEFSETDASVHSSSQQSRQFKRARRQTRILSAVSASPARTQEGSNSFLDVAVRRSHSSNPPTLLSQASLMRSSQVPQSQKRKRKGGF